MTDALIVQILSMMFCSISLGVFINPTSYKKILEDLSENESVAYLGGMIAFVIGFLLIALRSTITQDASMIITIFGWMSLIKGLLMIAVPKPILKIVKFFSKKKGFLLFGATITLFLGIVLIYIGFTMTFY